MAHTRKTLFLDKDTWDITLDSVGRIAVVSDEYATAQNIANEVRLFTEDGYFIQDQGIPHFVMELGHRANASVVRSYLRRAALRVADVKDVISIEIEDFNPVTRNLGGNIQFTTKEGEHNGTIRASL